MADKATSAQIKKAGRAKRRNTFGGLDRKIPGIERIRALFGRKGIPSDDEVLDRFLPRDGGIRALDTLSRPALGPPGTRSRERLLIHGAKPIKELTRNPDGTDEGDLDFFDSMLHVADREFKGPESLTIKFINPDGSITEGGTQDKEDLKMGFLLELLRQGALQRKLDTEGPPPSFQLTPGSKETERLRKIRDEKKKNLKGKHG